MHLFAHEILSKFHVFEVKQKTSLSVSAWFLQTTQFVLVEIFEITRNLYFFDPKNLLK